MTGDGGRMAEQPDINPWSPLFADGREGAEAKKTLTLLTPSALRKVNTPAQEAGPLSNTLSRALVLCGPTEGRALAEPLSRMAGPALQQVAKDFDQLRPEMIINVLSFVNALECVGVVEGLLAGSPVEAWLEALMKARGTLHEQLAYRCGLVALALGPPELAARFVGGGKLTEDFTPGRTFGFNVQGFVRYLATARLRKAPAEDVRPAWEAFVEAFPLKRAADTLDWKDLCWAARTCEAGFEHHPVAEVIGRLHARVKPA
ncbi:hypothetical protein [Corallococcus carmarthensis]|uniref:Uncharacterized protein n=1 Tax=Corallococcus carmarthensis TaxID=2316728 RepID=A0A3A8KGU3_9BACT|nr:hypothetical protein [Corallococcus carmarthensis]NOK15716.1 hypothetical protein [Corallococcus carmarthensis]RKH07363.1 hypothetical protein D7X32_02000 [Corallococcus carmarthensis]